MAENIINRSQKKAIIFLQGAVVSLDILRKLRQATESKKIAVRILTAVKGSYAISYQRRPISRGFRARDLNILPIEGG